MIFGPTAAAPWLGRRGWNCCVGERHPSENRARGRGARRGPALVVQLQAAAVCRRRFHCVSHEPSPNCSGASRSNK